MTFLRLFPLSIISSQETAPRLPIDVEDIWSTSCSMYYSIAILDYIDTA